MVDRTGGQLYTIEGFAAALIMLVTAWIVLGTTSVYTPGDTHISDMQLEQLGSDVLLMMDTPDTNTVSGKSPLQIFIENKDLHGPALFDQMFLAYCTNKTDLTTDTIQYAATVHYRKGTAPPLPNETKYYDYSQSRNLTQGDHAVRVTHWVLVDNRITNGANLVGASGMPPADPPSPREQMVLLEVLIWRG